MSSSTRSSAAIDRDYLTLSEWGEQELHDEELLLGYLIEQAREVGDLKSLSLLVDSRQKVRAELARRGANLPAVAREVKGPRGAF